MQTITINLQVPTSWMELNDKQLRYVYQLVAADISCQREQSGTCSDSAECSRNRSEAYFPIDEIKTVCLLQWSGTKVIGRQKTGTYLLCHGKTLFEIKPLAIAELLSQFSWLETMPPMPIRLSKMRGRKALPADFAEVPFETYIIVDNLYQGYLQTQSDELLDQLASVLYGKAMRLKPFERINVFYWVVSLKEYFSRRYPSFLKPVTATTGGNLLGSSTPNAEEAMNAQIRALTKGDITKEKEILAMDTWRALTELNAQAKEYDDFNAKYGNK